jgi:hypothetical protein
MIETPPEILAHHATRAAADSFTAWRKKIKKPLTETAALRIAKTLAAINAAGGDASDALGMAEERGWVSIKEEWYWRAERGNIRLTGADKQIRFAAEANRAFGGDPF